MEQKRKQRLWMTLVLVAAMVLIPVNSSQAKVKDLGPVGDNGRRVQIGGEEGIDPQYINTLTINADLSIKGSTAYVVASAAAKRVCTVTVVMRLQHKENGSWVTKKSWVTSSSNGFLAIEKTATLTKRGEYRTYALFDVAGEDLSYKSVVQIY